MKFLTIPWVVLAALVVIQNHASSYYLGYWETPTWLALSNKLFGLMAVIVIFMLFILQALWCELVKKKRFWSYIGLLVFWPVVLVTFWAGKASPEGGLIAHGLRDRVMRDVPLEQLREFAKEVEAAGLVKTEDLVNPADTSALKHEQKVELVKLVEKYPFMKWLNDGDRLLGPNLLDYGNPGIVNFEWAVQNRGHWGCSISVAGGKNEDIPFPDAKIYRVSDDIYFYYRA